MIPPFFQWAPLACLGAALAFIAIRSRRRRQRRRAWLRGGKR